MSLTGYKNGAIGESKAEEFLKKQGYKILQKNFACKQGEIDLIAKDGAVLVFVEVKARQSLEFGRPIEYVTASKIQKIKKAATFYLYIKHLNDVDVRFDVVEIFGDEIELIKDAF